MKDGFMILVLILVMISPMFPFLLKGKCPKCKKRKLENLETTQKRKGQKLIYITHYFCHACESKFEQTKSGPLRAVEAYSVESGAAVTSEPVAAINGSTHDTPGTKQTSSQNAGSAV